MLMTKKSQAVDNNPLSGTSLRIIFWVLFVLVVIAALTVPLLLSSEKKASIGHLREKYKVGSLSDEDVIAKETFYYIDEVLTKEAQQTAANAVLPQFVFSLGITMETIELVDAVFSAISNESTEIEALGKSRALLEQQNIVDENNLLGAVYSLSPQARSTIRNVVRETLRAMLSAGVYDRDQIHMIEQKGYDRLEVYSTLSSERPDPPLIHSITNVATQDKITSTLVTILRRYRSDLTVNQNVLVLDLVVLFLRPNVLYDELETAFERQKASENVMPVTVKVDSGQYVLKKDFVITGQDLRTMQAMVLAEASYSFMEIIGMALFILITTSSAVYVLRYLFANSIRRDFFVVFFLGGVLVTQIATYLVLKLFVNSDFPTLDPLLPVLVLPIMLSVITNRKRAGYVAAVLLGSYAMLLPTATLTTVFFIVAECFCGIHFIKYVSRRIDMLFQWFFGIVATTFIVMMNNLLLGYGFESIVMLMTASVVNITLTYILVTVMLPLVERLFNIPTSFRLRELAYGDSPLLARLAQNAQGTYNHVQAVADLAYAAANAIGADALLARVGALYHDIGKLDHPEYFIENQDGENKHSELKTSLSVAIIKSHVKLGVEKGRDAGLPKEVLDIISQHHGNDVIAYFYKEAQDEALLNGKGRVKPEDYMYASLVPQSPEAAIVMLADSVEAASRSIKKPSVQKYEKLIHQIVVGKIQRKQLKASRLSFSDLDMIVSSFIQTIAGKYHTRLEYPDTNTEEGDDEQ